MPVKERSCGNYSSYKDFFEFATFMIPNIIHFVFGLSTDFGQRPFLLIHHLAIKSAYEVNRPDKIYFVCAQEPQGEYFERSREYVEVVKITPPDSIFGHPLMHYAHKADIVRMERLIAYGGIYLDLDVICLKPLTPFLVGDKAVLGKLYEYFRYEPKTFLRKVLKFFRLHDPGEIRNYVGLCNAVIIAPPNDPFILRWYDTYRYFRSKGHDLYWDEQSVQVPGKLAEIYWGEVDVLEDNHFFYPSYDEWGLRALYQESNAYEDAYIFHLWESLVYEKHLQHLTEDMIRTEDTTYNVAARRFL